MMASMPARCNTSWATATSCTRCDIPSCAPTASMGSGRTEGAHIGRNRRHGRAPRWQRMSKTGMRFLWPPPSAPNSNRLFSNLASRLYVLPSDAHVLAHLADRLKLAWPIDAADLNQHRWLKVEPALVVVLD